MPFRSSFSGLVRLRRAARPGQYPRRRDPVTPAQPTTPPTDAQVLSNGIFHDNADDGTVGHSSAEVLSALADKIKATDILSTPALDNAVIGELQDLPRPARRPRRPDQGLLRPDAAGLRPAQGGPDLRRVEILYSMSDYTDLDAGISRELAHRIEAIWNSDRTQNGLEIANTKLRNNLDTDIHNADLTADDLHQQDLEENAKPGRQGSSSGGSQSSSSATNSPLLSPTPIPSRPRPPCCPR